MARVNPTTASVFPGKPPVPLEAIGLKAVREAAKILSYLDMPGIIAGLLFCEGFPGECEKLQNALEAYERLYRVFTVSVGGEG